jgi:hypothetical protein
MKVWEVVFRKPLSEKQTHPKYGNKSQLAVLTMKTPPGKIRFDWKVFSVTRKVFFVNQLF